MCKTTYKEKLIEMRIGFHASKKDMCWCHEFETKSAEERMAKETEYLQHIRRKKVSENEKNNDYLRTKDKNFISANFDLEAVLYTPLVFAKPVFYKRKLASFNFTIYDVGKRNGYCFFWTETEGNRGANEIATCLLQYLQQLPSHVTHISFFSDSCPGQNKNSIVAAMFQYALEVTTGIEIIDLKFLEPGHTHMQCDSMHATIEAASQHSKIYTPH